MRFPRWWPVVVLAPAIALAIGAGPSQEDFKSPFATLRCYQEATLRQGLINEQAKQLCIGAESDAPVACYAEATQRLALTDVDSIRLCQLANSVEPARCVARLEQTTSFDQATEVQYCAAARYALAPPSEPGSAFCLQAARSETFLTDQDQVRLCLGSQTSYPADCFAWGRRNMTVTDQDLLELCAPVVPYAAPYGVALPGVPPYSAPPPP